MQTVHQLLQTKGREVWTIGAEASVYDALALMAEKDIGALVVTQGSQVLGLLSERNYARNVVLQGLKSQDTQVSEIMTGSLRGPAADGADRASIVNSARTPPAGHGR